MITTLLLKLRGVTILTPPSVSMKPRREVHDVDISILYAVQKSFERNGSLDARVLSGYAWSRYRPPRTHTFLFVRLKIDLDHLTHFFETRASWYLILRPQSSVNGVAGGYIRAGTGSLAHSPALVFTRLNAAQKGECNGQSARTARALTRTLHGEELDLDEEIPVDYCCRCGGGK